MSRPPAQQKRLSNLCRVLLPDGSTRAFPLGPNDSADDLKQLIVRRMCTEQYGSVDRNNLRETERAYADYGIFVEDELTNTLALQRPYVSVHHAASVARVGESGAPELVFQRREAGEPLLELYEAVMDSAMSAIGLPTRLKQHCMAEVFQNSSVRSRVSGGSMQVPSSSEYALIGRIHALCGVFLDKQVEAQAAARIQALWRGHQWRKHGLPRVRAAYNKPQMEAFWRILKQEGEYTRSMATLVSSIVLPLMGSADKQLKEQTMDLQELLVALRAIEALHRQLGRKLRWFLDEGCEWPHVSRFGTLYEDMALEFHVYGPYIRNFQFAVGVMDRTMVDQTERPRLRQFLLEKDVDFKIEMTKPLNHLATIESALRAMADAMEWSDPDRRAVDIAASIMNEANKFIHSAMDQAGNVARVKEIESRLMLSKKMPEPQELAFLRHISAAVHKKEVRAHVWKAANKAKKEVGSVVVFDCMAVVLVRAKAGDKYKIKAAFSAETHPVRVAESPDGAVVLCYVQGKEEGSPEVPGSRVKFQADDVMEGKELFELLRAFTCSRGVYGADFGEVVEREMKAGHSSQPVPLIIQKAFEWMSAHALSVEGLFRIPGSAQAEKGLVAACDKGAEHVDLEAWPGLTCHDVAGLVKLYFRELPRSLCGPLFERLVAAHRSMKDDTDKYIARIRELLAELPSKNAATFQYVVRGLAAIAAHHETNMMNPLNLAVCIGPDLMRPDSDDLQLVLQLPIANEVLAVIIEHADRVFE